MSVVFTGGARVALRPGEEHLLPLGQGSVTVWNVDALDFVGEVDCTDVSGYVATLAWRPPGP